MYRFINGVPLYIFKPCHPSECLCTRLHQGRAFLRPGAIVVALVLPSGCAGAPIWQALQQSSGPCVRPSFGLPPHFTARRGRTRTACSSAEGPEAAVNWLAAGALLERRTWRGERSSPALPWRLWWPSSGREWQQQLFGHGEGPGADPLPPAAPAATCCASRRLSLPAARLFPSPLLFLAAPLPSPSSAT